MAIPLILPSSAQAPNAILGMLREIERPSPGRMPSKDAAEADRIGDALFAPSSNHILREMRTEDES